MFRFVTVFAFVSCVWAGIVTNSRHGRIVNGVDTTIEAHPYQVSLQTTHGNYLCGGSIISEDIVLTAAHCMRYFSASDYVVRLGSTVYNDGGLLVPVKDFKSHEGFNPSTKVNDVAVIKLATPVSESDTIRYIKLATTTPPTGLLAIVTGWGSKCEVNCAKLTETLQEVDVAIVDKETCASDQYQYGNEIMETMVCAYAPNKDSCQGDSGGPLVARNELVGIVSWGYGCAREGHPGVYCDIPSVRSWIEKTAKEL